MRWGMRGASLLVWTAVLLTSCGGGGGTAPPDDGPGDDPPTPPAVSFFTPGSFASEFSVPLHVAGSDLAPVGGEVTISLTATTGTPFLAGTSATLEVRGRIDSAVSISGATPPSCGLSHDVQATVSVVLPGASPLAVEGDPVTVVAPRLGEVDPGEMLSRLPKAFTIPSLGLAGVSGAAAVRFTATTGTPFLDGVAGELEIPVTVESAPVEVAGVTTFPDGSYAVTGTFSGMETFGAGEARETTLTSDGETDLFVARYQADDSLAWAVRGGGLVADGAGDIGGFGDGSCVVTGWFGGTNDGIVAIRFRADGTMAWTRRPDNGTDEGRGRSVAALADGACLVTGDFTGTATFGAGTADETVLTSLGARDVFLARYEADGSFAWAVRTGDAGDDQVRDLGAFADGTSVLVLARSGGMRLEKRASNGAWAGTEDVSGVVQGRAVATDSLGYFCVTGEFRGAVTFGAGSGTPKTVYAASGRTNVFVARYTSIWGWPLWAVRNTDEACARDVARSADGLRVLVAGSQGGASPAAYVQQYWVSDGSPSAKRLAQGGESEGYAVAAFADGTWAAAGTVRGPTTFGSGESSAVVLTGDGGRDAFVTRYEDGGAHLRAALCSRVARDPDAPVVVRGTTPFGLCAEEAEATVTLLLPSGIVLSVPGSVTFAPEAKLLPSDGAASDYFGRSVALSGDTALVGAFYDDDNGSASGSAYVFVRSGATWTQQQKLLPSEGAASDQFGISVALSGDTALVGARGDDDDNGSESGGAYIH